MAKHTPTPYHLSIQDDLSDVEVILNSSGKAIGHVAAYDEEGKSTARFIVTACNAHNDLLEALKSVNRILSPGNRSMDDALEDMNDALDICRSAIARIEGTAK